MSFIEEKCVKKGEYLTQELPCLEAIWSSLTDGVNAVIVINEYAIRSRNHDVVVNEVVPSRD